jgi:hypothetical protein
LIKLPWNYLQSAEPSHLPFLLLHHHHRHRLLLLRIKPLFALPFLSIDQASMESSNSRTFSSPVSSTSSSSSSSSSSASSDYGAVFFAVSVH